MKESTNQAFIRALPKNILHNMNDVCRFTRDHVAEYSERTVLSCLEPVCLYWRRFVRYFSHHQNTSFTDFRVRLVFRSLQLISERLGSALLIKQALP